MVPFVAGTNVNPPFPQHLRLPLGPISNVRMLGRGELFPLRMANTEAKRAGRRYERAAITYLEGFVATKQLPVLAKFGQWWGFDAGMEHGRKCQTDVVFLNHEKQLATIIEVKKLHTTEAWWQLRRYYEPVLRAFYSPGWQFNCIEMCKTFDPSFPFPEPIYDVESLENWVTMVQPGLGVFRWRG